MGFPKICWGKIQILRGNKTDILSLQNQRSTHALNISSPKNSYGIILVQPVVVSSGH